MQACGTGVGQKTGSGLCNPNKEIFKILLNVFFLIISKAFFFVIIILVSDVPLML